MSELLLVLTSSYDINVLTDTAICYCINYLLSKTSTSRPEIWFHLFSFTGLGFGMMYLPAVVGVGYYFEKKRALATGIAVCGTGIGTFALAPLAKFLLDILDWKNTHYVLGK